MSQDERMNLSEALSSGPMMRELNRWNHSSRVKPVSFGWAEWARSTVEQYRPVTARRGAARMTLAHPLMLVERRERLINFSLNIHSRMNLAIQPILREMRSKAAQALREQPVQLGASSSRRAGTNAVADRADNSSVPDQAISLHPVARVVNAAAEHSNRSSATLAVEDRAIPLSASYNPNNVESLPRGLPLVFRRLDQLDESTSLHRRSVTIYESVERTALRVAERSKRVEQPVKGGAPMVARQAPAPKAQQAAPQVVTTEHEAAYVPGMFKAKQSWSGNAPQMSEAVVEQLTEHVIRQIDRRAIAWRERMGKI